MKLGSSYFDIISPHQDPLPILISIPHSGTNFPDELKDQYLDDTLKRPEDTDWFVDRLYSFAPRIGITLIKANLSRYVVDLNRDPRGEALYNDNRAETSVVPIRTFSGKRIYKNDCPGIDEVQSRIQNYFLPYHDEVSNLLTDLRAKFDHVLFFDAHSIKRNVSTISPKPFADLIVGNQNAKTCGKELSHLTLEILSNSEYSVMDNDPFKGGYLTRSFGKPLQGIHSLQLEMSQDIYMDEEKILYSENKASAVSKMLENLLMKLSENLGEF